MKWLWLDWKVCLASLVFIDMQSHNAERQPCYYDKKAITIDTTKLKLSGDRLRIKGLSDDKFLLCFREGRLVFPNNPLDQMHKVEMQVYEGDLFFWTKPAWQPRTFVQDLFSGNLNVDKERAYTFKLAKEEALTTKESVRSKAVAFQYQGRRYLIDYGVPVILVIFMVALISGLLIAFLAPGPVGSPACRNPNNIQFHTLDFVTNSSSHDWLWMTFEVEKDCREPPFDWKRYHDNILHCLQEWKPEIDSFDWIHYFNDREMFYANSNDPRIINKCSYKDHH